jgi:hypothetical protein
MVVAASNRMFDKITIPMSSDIQEKEFQFVHYA